MDEQLPFAKPGERLEGDREVALGHLPAARKLLFHVRRVVANSLVPIFAATRKLPDGSTIHASMIDGVGRVRVHGVAKNAGQVGGREDFLGRDRIVVHIQVQIGATFSAAASPPYVGGTWYVIETSEKFEQGRIVSTSVGDPHYDYFFGHARVRSREPALDFSGVVTPPTRAVSFGTPAGIPAANLRGGGPTGTPVSAYTFTATFPGGNVAGRRQTQAQFSAGITVQGFTYIPVRQNVTYGASQLISVVLLGLTPLNFEQEGVQYTATSSAQWRITMTHYSGYGELGLRKWMVAGGLGGQRVLGGAPDGESYLTAQSTYYRDWSTPVQVHGSAGSPPAWYTSDTLPGVPSAADDPLPPTVGEGWTPVTVGTPTVAPAVITSEVLAVAGGQPELRAVDAASLSAKIGALYAFGAGTPDYTAQLSRHRELNGTAWPELVAVTRAESGAFNTYRPGQLTVPASSTPYPPGATGYGGHWPFKEGIVSAFNPGGGWVFYFQKHGRSTPEYSKSLADILPPELAGATLVQFMEKNFHAAYERFVGRTRP